MRRIVLSSTAAILATLLLAACVAAPSQQKVVLVVAATDNFRPVLEQLAQDYCARQPWVTLELHTANTARLEQDLKDGAAFDLYIPARPGSMIALAKSDAINPRSLVILPHNELVVIAPLDSSLSQHYQELTNANVRQIAVASPDLLLGFLTKEALTSLQYLPSDEALPLVPPNNPAAALALSQTQNLNSRLLVLNTEADVLAAVKDGRAQAGITFHSSAIADQKVRVLTPLPDGAYEPIDYTAAIPRNAPHNDEAWHFLDYLRSAEAHATMQRNGLTE